MAFDSDPRPDAFFCRNGLEGLLFFYNKTPEQILAQAQEALADGREQYAEQLENTILPQLKEYHANKESYDQAIKNWHVLFKLNSLIEVGMCWWDAGILQFLIDKNDLMNRNFSNTYATIASS